MYVWTDSLSVGIKEMDDQHRHLFDITNKVFLHMAKRQDERDGSAHTLLDDIMNYTFYHVRQEEEYMREFSCEDIVHIGMHRWYEHRMKTLFDRASQATRKGLTDADRACLDLARFTGDWHLAHLQRMDRRYTTCFKEHGLTGAEGEAPQKIGA